MSNNEELRCVISDLIEQNKAVTKQRDIAVAALKCVVEMPRAHSSVRIATMALAEIEGEDRDV